MHNSVVTEVGQDSSSGIYMRYETDNGYTVTIAHLSETIAKPGDRILQGQHIAYSGNTGNSSGPHLHLTLRKNDKLIDPLSVMDMVVK